jgi:hypothetical protein
MTEDVQGRKRNRRRLWWGLAVPALLLAVLVVPPMVSVSRYKSRIAHLMAASLGRPVRLSSVEVRLLPRPGFVLTDLSVEDDPAFGAEPILHANSVTASIRMLSLWRGRLEIGAISVDEASLNVARNADGRWNIESLFRSAASKSGPGARHTLPYLEATDSRINLRNGIEKLPYSLVNTDLSFWQENPGDWRLRLRGQPARTDLSLQLGDTGTVRLEGSLRDAGTLEQMPIHLDLEWKEAQFGQLSRLLAGADPGWRGDLTGELHLDGNAETAQVKTRLRAAGVHRAEFTPESPLDFDARCNFIWHNERRGAEALLCDSPLGNGRLRVSGDLPGEAAAQPHLTVELDKVPVAAGMDALRTVRSDFAPGVEVKGAVSGKIVYSRAVAEPPAEKPARPRGRVLKAPPEPAGPLTGSLTVEGFQLSGGGLSTPIAVPKITLAPASDGDREALETTIPIPAGGTTPLILSSRLSPAGYRIGLKGSAAIVRARELAHLSGDSASAQLNDLAGEPLTVDLSAQGPWMPAEKILSHAPGEGVQAVPESAAGDEAPPDRLIGTVTLHNVNWKADYLANRLVLSQAVLHLDPHQTRWDPVAFSYGPVKGSARLTQPESCAAACTPRFEVQFGQLDAGVLQAAILGAQEKVTLIATLLARLHPAAAPAWPRLEGTVRADSLTLGPLTLRDAQALIRTTETGVEITGLDGALLGGRLHASGSLETPKNAQQKPTYRFEAHGEKLSPAAVGLLLDQHWSGGPMNIDGKAVLSGFTQADLAASATGVLHFDWQHGTASGAPSDLAHFDRWAGVAEISRGAMTLQENEVRRGIRTASVKASAALGAGAKLTFAAPAEAAARK